MLRQRLRLRVRLAPRAGGLVFRRDARADLVGVRARRRAVDDGLGGRRRRLRARRLRRTLVSNLFARFAVAAIAPVDSLTIRRAVPEGSTVTAAPDP